MEVQLCGGPVQILPLTKDPQATMLQRSLEFQRSLGMWDERISSLPEKSHVDVVRCLHQVDMARQEVSEAWDLVEGGWKHHKTKPRETPMDELAMEIVDVAVFCANAYLYMGGLTASEQVAQAISWPEDRILRLRMGLDDAWHIGEQSWRLDGLHLRALYSHGDGAHGSDEVKEIATRLNHLAAKISALAETMREGIQHAGMGPSFPASPGFLYVHTFPWIYGVAAAIPDMTQELFFSIYMAKMQINFDRQTKGY